MLLKLNLQRGKTHEEYYSSRKYDDVIFERVQKNIPDPNLIAPSPEKRDFMLMRKRKKLAVLGVAEFVESVMMATKIK